MKISENLSGHFHRVAQLLQTPATGQTHQKGLGAVMIALSLTAISAWTKCKAADVHSYMLLLH